jgi:hypothetical protein
VVDHDIDGLVAEVVDVRQALEPLTVLERVAHEVQRPHLVRSLRLDERSTFNRDSFTASAPLHL